MKYIILLVYIARGGTAIHSKISSLCVICDKKTSRPERSELAKQSMPMAALNIAHLKIVH